MPEQVRLMVNGVWQTVEQDPSSRLHEVLREVLGQWDVKEGCATGHCGACTVLIDGVPNKSCLRLLGQMDGRQVTTLKGLATDAETAALKAAFVRHGAVQCGYCTPGMIVTATALVKSARKSGRTLSRVEVRAGLVGNLCRCTGYHKIVDAVEEVATR
jgi:carbon-monoxide dehydrogenase small subunit